MKSTHFDENWRNSIIFVDHRRKMTLIDVVWRRLTLIDVKWRKWTSFDDDWRLLNVKNRRGIFWKILKIFKIFENGQNLSKIDNFQRAQRNSSKNVMSDASSRMTLFDVSRRQHSTLDVDRRQKSTNDVIWRQTTSFALDVPTNIAINRSVSIGWNFHFSIICRPFKVNLLLNFLFFKPAALVNTRKNILTAHFNSIIWYNYA